MARAGLIGFLVWLLAGFATPSALAAEPGRAAFDTRIEAAKSAMMTDPQRALQLAEQARQQSMALPQDEQGVARATALWLVAEANIGLNRLDDAQRNLDEALALIVAAAPDSKVHGDLMRSKGAIAAINGKSAEALSDYLAAHRIFRTLKETRSQAITLQDIGTIYGEAGDYERELSYLEQAREVYGDDSKLTLITNNNRAEAYRNLGRYADAEKAFMAALAGARELQSPLLETRILTNLALVQVEQGKLAEASRNAAAAARVGTSEEALDWLPFVYGAQAAIAEKRGDDSMAITRLEQLFADTDFTTTDLAYREFHELAARIYSRNGQPAKALAHFQAFQRLDSEARDLISTASSQLLGAQFNSANQRARIAQLKQGQLERDFEIAQQKTLIVQALLGAAVLLILGAGVALHSIRKSRNEVRAANTVLTEVNTKLERALKAKTDFLAMTSHEIRTPLNGIIGMTQVLLTDESLDAQTRERVSLVLGAGQTMQSLVDDLLDVAKMENAGISVSTAPTDVGAIVSEGVQLWKAEASARGVDIVLLAEGAIPLVQTDAGRLRQVIFNLLANAVKFTQGGRITVTLGQASDQMVEILVEDTGIGIPADQLETIFEAFHQVDNGMSRDFGGAGLGLAICRNIMTALGGAISATSRFGEGSQFRVTLPLGTVANAPVSNPAADSAGHSPHHLPDAIAVSTSASAGFCVIVDANELRLAKVKAILEPHVPTIVGMTTISKAAPLIENRQASLVVVDTSALDGDDDRAAALAQLISLAKGAGAAVVVLLGADDGIDPSAVEATGPDILLQKPIKAAALIGAVRNVAGTQSFQSQVA